MVDFSDIDCSDARYVPETKTTIAGIDSAIILVVFASAAFWMAVAAAIWFWM
ncbi:MAG TPA: hypothetical protein VJS47_03160 [Rhizomicrobium sp.]|nr:hypothetical protein [Rhizomicrobium sp.]